MYNLSIHDLTRRSTIILKEQDIRGVIFQFTTSQGGRPGRSTGSETGRNLSIHDLTRRSTGVGDQLEILDRLSIHDLTRRSTMFFSFSRIVNALSIHDLTRRSTRQGSGETEKQNSFNSRPHKEVDLGCFIPEHS